MSRQEFFDPEQSYDEAQQSETGYHEQQELMGEYPGWERYNDAGNHHRVGEKLRPRRCHKSTIGALTALLVLMVFIACGILGFTISNLSSSLHAFPWRMHTRPGYMVNSMPLQSFPVKGSAHLIINDPAAGAIHVHTGDTDHVVIQAITPPSHTPPLQTKQSNNTIDINVNAHEDDEDSPGVVLDVYTPSNASVDIKADAATVDISGVNGQISATTGDGSINAAQDRGTLNLATGGGHIGVINDSLNGPSSMKTEDGDITFVGTLDPHGTYQFSSQSGSIDLSLPEDSSFHLDTAATDSTDMTNEFGSDVVGNNPQATVSIHTEEGSIAVHKIISGN